MIKSFFLFKTFFLVFPFNQGLPQRMMFLYSVLFSMFFSLAPTLSISFFTTSRNFLFGLPLFLFPDNSISITLLLTYAWSLILTYPQHLSLPSLIFSPNRSTLIIPLLLMYLFLIFIFSRYSHSKLNIFFSATSISSIYFFVAPTVSCPYNIAGLTIELYNFSFTLAGNLMSQITPDNFLHSFHPACILLSTSLLQLPLSCTVDPKYLNSFTLGSFVFSIFTVFCHFLHLRTDIMSLSYLLSSLFFPTHTSSILVSVLLLPWFIRKSQYYQQTASFTVVLSLLRPLAYSIITANKNGLNDDPWCSPTLI